MLAAFRPQQQSRAEQEFSHMHNTQVSANVSAENGASRGSHPAFRLAASEATPWPLALSLLIFRALERAHRMIDAHTHTLHVVREAKADDKRATHNKTVSRGRT